MYYKRNSSMQLRQEANPVNIGEGLFSCIKKLTGHADSPIQISPTLSNLNNYIFPIFNGFASCLNCMLFFSFIVQYSDKLYYIIRVGLLIWHNYQKNVVQWCPK